MVPGCPMLFIIGRKAESKAVNLYDTRPMFDILCLNKVNWSLQVPETSNLYVDPGI
jgi:hypothetical protein